MKAVLSLAVHFNTD